MTKTKYIIIFFKETLIAALGNWNIFVKHFAFFYVPNRDGSGLSCLVWVGSQDQWSTEAGKIPKYRIPKLLYSNRTEPNNTEPNLIVDENEGFLLFGNFFTILLCFYVTMFSKILKFRQNKSIFLKIDL